MSYNSHHWGPPRHNNATSSSGQSTGEGGGGSGGRHSLEMEPMLSSSSSSGHGHKGNDRIGNALGRLTGGSGSSKYHGKRTSSSSAGKLLLIGLACLAMMYLGFGVGRDGQVDTAKSPAGSGESKASPTTPMVRKPNPSSGKVDQKQIQESEMPNDDDEPSDEDEEDDKMLESSAEEDDNSSSGERKGEDDTSKVADRPYVGSLADKEDPKLPESIANAVVEDTEALEDDEDEDDDATQDFAPEDDEDDAADADDGTNDDVDDTDSGADDDDSTEDFSDEDKDGVVEPSPEEKLAQQNLEDDDNVVDDDTVSPDTVDDDDEGAQDDDSSDDDDEEDDAGGANAIAQKLLPGGVSKTPIMDYRIPDTVHKRFIKWSKELHQITEMEEYKGGEPKVNWEWHPRKRRDRFPGVEERVSDDPINALVLGCSESARSMCCITCISLSHRYQHLFQRSNTTWANGLIRPSRCTATRSARHRMPPLGLPEPLASCPPTE